MPKCLNITKIIKQKDPRQAVLYATRFYCKVATSQISKKPKNNLI